MKRALPAIILLKRGRDVRCPMSRRRGRPRSHVSARAHLYKALDNIDIDGLTLSFAATSYPCELFRYLRETLGCAVE